MENTAKVRWYQTSWAAILLLIFFFPVGLFLMWKYTKWPKPAKWVVSAVFGLFLLIGVFTDSPETTSNTQAKQQQVTLAPQTQVTVETTQEIAKTTATTAPTQAKQVAKPTTPPVTSETVSQKNAIKKAKSYLDYSGFSRDGLVDQLEYEQFSHEDAVYGADNAGGNWMEEAAQKAQSYMEYSAFSRGSLIEQLKYEKFTQEQAEYGANSVGL